MKTEILRLPIVASRIGLGRASIYQKIAAGTFPPTVSLGARAVGWLESEVSAWIDARVAGKNDDEIRALVAKMKAARTAGGEGVQS